MTRIPAAQAGILLMLLGMALFSLNDALGKWLVATHSVGQVLLIRSLAALVVLLPVLWSFGPRRLLAVERPGLQALRVAFSTAEVFCFYLAVRDLPLADVMTFWLAVPIYVAAISPLLLGERVGPVRWLAILLGFGGVLVALAPSGEMSGTATVAALVGSACFAAMILTGRSLRGTPDTALVFWQLVGAGLAGLVAAPLAWTTPSAFDWGLLSLLGVVAMLAHLCITRALKLAPAALVAPLQYTLLPWAIVLGWLFFADLPTWPMLAGGAIIVGAGLLLLVPERRAAPAPR
ncbi:DMT family transporter [Rubellimicrobium sp. CFH 75288]|uniref:DMT family transporter n=1 Tax=Rubellimicrobium sp. CFH 75288 TaxID=2697034 RepID=UPI001412E04C|nr:DMT family transporter [Rubellimicrobium sp. CFH 75288]NAZ36201.1 EamA family transporter [Rubellimicrobium sp. CFH 75288]